MLDFSFLSWYNYYNKKEGFKMKKLINKIVRVVLYLDNCLLKIGERIL